MTKPENLPPQTSKHHDYLVSKGWRYIGCRRSKYGPHYYWDYYIGTSDEGCWSEPFIQGAAVTRQKALDKLARRSGGR